MTVLCTIGVAVLLGAAAVPDAPVADAAMRADVEEVRSLLRSGAEVNAAQGDGMTALHWAAETGSAELARLLIYAGANLEAVTRVAYYTPLHIASEAGNGAVVRGLLEAGAHVHATTRGGLTPLHNAARAGSVEAIQALLDHGADVNSRESAWGQTPLMLAGSKNRVDAVRALLEGGADPAVTSKVMEFSWLARQGRIAGAVRDSVLAAFRERSPNPTLWLPDASQVQAALRAAREHEAVEPVEAEEIVRIDWDSAQTAGRRPSGPEQAGYQGGLTALLHAVREGNTEAALALLEGRADINQRSGGDLSPPLLMAMMNGHFDLGLELLRRGADPNLASHPSGMTPLYAVINTQWASKARYPQQQAYKQQQATHLEAMEALLQAGADPNARLALNYWFLGYNFGGVGIDFWGATPFFRAAHGLDVDAMKLLVSYGADPDIPTKAPPGDRHGGGDLPPSLEDLSGLPPVPDGGPGMHPIHAVSGNSGEGAGRAGNFHMHVRDGWLPALKYLVEELGADVTLRDYLGYGTIHGAAGRGMTDVVQYLLEKGADPLTVGRSGMTTVDMANGPANGLSPFPETIRLLESLGAKNNNVCVAVGSC
jgi:ankyrin repeat protein